MTDSWYYAEGQNSRGPVSLAELMAALARTADPRRVLVWRQGFDNWKPVELVDEVTAQLPPPPAPKPVPPPPPPGPPAAPRAVPPPAPPRAAAIADAAGAAMPAAATPHLAGIGGWLIFIAIGQVLGPVRTGIALVKYYTSEVNGDFFTEYTLTFYGELLMNVAFLAFMIITAVFFFRHSRLFPRLFILELVLTATLPLIDMLWAAVTVSAVSGTNIADLLSLDPQDIGQVVATVIIGPIWIAYILRSRRVANTFVK